jgi:O-antigen/teichoic acid export membrane protein
VKPFHAIMLYSSSVYFRQFLNIFLTYLRPVVLGPTLYGLWSLFNLIPQYVTYAHLGIRTGMRYRVPECLGKGELDQAKRIEATTFWCTAVFYSAVALTLLGISLWSSHTTVVRVGFAAFSLIVMLLFVMEYQFAVMKGRQEFKRLSGFMYLRAILNFGVIVALIWSLGIYALFLGIILPAGVVAYLATKPRYDGKRLPPRKIARWSQAGSLMRVGIPIALFNILLMLIVSADRLIIGWMEGTEQVGYYALASAGVMFLLTIARASRDVTEPVMIHQNAQSPSGDTLRKSFEKPLVLTSYLQPLLLLPACFFLPPVIRLILPQYEASIVPAQILILSSFFMALAYGVRGFTILAKLRRKMLVLLPLPLILNVGLNVWTLHAGYGIVGVSIASGVSFVVLFAMMAMLCWEKADSLRPAFARTLLDVLIAFVGLILPGVAIYLAGQHIMEPGLLRALAMTGAYLLPAGLVLLFTEGRHQLIHHTKRIFCHAHHADSEHP